MFLIIIFIRVAALTLQFSLSFYEPSKSYSLKSTDESKNENWHEEGKEGKEEVKERLKNEMEKTEI